MDENYHPCNLLYSCFSTLLLQVDIWPVFDGTHTRNMPKKASGGEMPQLGSVIYILWFCNVDFVHQEFQNSFFTIQNEWIQEPLSEFKMQQRRNHLFLPLEEMSHVA